MNRTTACCALLWAVLPAAAPPALAATLDFEVGSHDQMIPDNTYRHLGAKLIGGAIFDPPAGGWDLVHSGTRGMYPANLSSIDGTTAAEIALEHVGMTNARVADLMFVVPGTDQPGLVDDFTMWIGFDPVAGPGEGNYIIIEGFKHEEGKHHLLTSVSLIGITEQFHAFSLTGTTRLRLTQVGGVGFDDVSFGPVRPIPEPTTLSALAGLALAGLGTLRRRRPARTSFAAGR